MGGMVILQADFEAAAPVPGSGEGGRTEFNMGTHGITVVSVAPRRAPRDLEKFHSQTALMPLATRPALSTDARHRQRTCTVHEGEVQS
eukprot:SAG11_NODE_4656_length_1819_cov_1.351163_3_plen_88_part_00